MIGLGANLGDRLTTMRDAVARIAKVTTVTARSRVYETAPVGLVEQPSFLNAAIAVDVAIDPLGLLETLLGIERELGRDRTADAVRWGPRTIDLDVLWFDGVVFDNPRLVVPHPRVSERAFAMVPLLEVAPHARDARTGNLYVAPIDDGVRLTDLVL